MKVERGGDALGCIDRARERKGETRWWEVALRWFLQGWKIFTPGDTNVHTETGAAIDNNIYIRILNQKDFASFLYLSELFIVRYYWYFPPFPHWFLYRTLLGNVLILLMLLCLFIFSLSGESWTQLKGILNWLSDINTITTTNTSNVGLQHCWR